MAAETVEPALGFLCNVLSPWTPAEENLALLREAEGGKVDWQAVAYYANRFELVPSLCVALHNRGIFPVIPQAFRDYLDELYRFNRQRNGALLDHLGGVVLLLNGIGVTPLLLKGGAALATDLYPDAGMRFMWDLDLLVPEETLEASVGALQAAGYRVPEQFISPLTAGSGSFFGHHYHGLIRPGDPARIELHRWVLAKEIDLLPPETVWSNCRPHEGGQLPGATALLMSPTDELLYCFAHSELAHGNHRRWRLDGRQLHHFAHLVYRHADQIDWERLALVGQHPRYGRIFQNYLHLARRLFRVNLPLTYAADSSVERHVRRVTTTRRGWKLWLHAVRMTCREAVWSLSSERLRSLYRQQGEMSVARLRLNHLRYLFGRYWRVDPWRRKLMSLLNL
jgi:hypothetical protein